MRQSQRPSPEFAPEPPPGRLTLDRRPGGEALAGPRLAGTLASLKRLEGTGQRHPPARSPALDASRAAAGRTEGMPMRNAIDAYAMHAFAANGFGDADVGGAAPLPVRPGDRLDRHADAHRASRSTRIVEASLRIAAALARRLVDRWSRWRKAHETFHALRELDARTLRDLGLDRSEILSAVAEIAGDADPTRARSIQALRSTLL